VLETIAQQIDQLLEDQNEKIEFRMKTLEELN